MFGYLKDFQSFRPRAFRHDKHLFVKCRVRSKDVRCTPEERIRQSVLGFLFEEKGWAPSSVELERRIEFADGFHGRADILLLDDKGEAALVIECKEGALSLGEDVRRQAVRYAQSLRVSAVWITNGKEHGFYSKVDAGIWEQVEKLPYLEESNPIPKPVVPPSNSRDLARFDLQCLRSRTLRGFAVSMLNVIFSPPGFFKLPWGHRGIHILEDRGISRLSIGTPGGSWNSSYRLFLIATEGRVETAGIGLNRWGDDRLILCVSFLKSGRKHHALQLQVDDWVDNRGDHFEIFHNGRMGGRSIKKEVVVDALYEACRDDILIETGELFLGSLPNDPAEVNQISSRAFIANLLHYALIRTELREAYACSKQ